MELAAIVTSVVVFVLQIVTIAKISGLKKAVREMSDRKPQQQYPNQERPRRDQDFRRNSRDRGRPIQEPRNKPQMTTPTTTPAANEAVESSLRDINLRLKNAERDQDLARRKLQEGNLGNRENRESREGRDNRDRSRRDDRRGGNQDRGRDRRPNWQDRGRRDFSRSQGAPTDQPSDESKDFEPVLNQEPVSQPQPTETASNEVDLAAIERNAPEMPASDFAAEDSMQHGRRIQVKRRLLKEGEAGQGEAEGSSDASSQDSQEGNVAEEQQRPSEIRFGRR